MEYTFGAIQKYIEDESLLPDPSKEEFQKFVIGVATKFFENSVDLSEETLANHQDSLRQLWAKRGDTYKLFEVYIDSYLGIAMAYREQALTKDIAQDYRFPALTQLQARSVLVLREIQALLEAGYPDGAMARWRTLHELAVFSCVIEASSESSRCFLLSEDINNAKSAKCYNEHASTLGLDPYTPDEIIEIEKQEKQATELLGEINSKSDYFWALPYLKKNGYAGTRPTFYDLEKYSEMGHYRPYFKLACEKVHVPSKLNYAGLATDGAGEVGLLVGPSMRGHEIPLEMAMESTMITLRNFMNLDCPSIDGIVFMELMNVCQGKLLESLAKPAAFEQV